MVWPYSCCALSVVDMGNVVKALSYLEKTPITKEALEATRLGKTVNDIRKKTNDKDLAARCKSLVRQWQKQFVRSSQKKDPATPTPGAEADGVRSAHSQGDVTPTGRPPSRGLQAASSVDKSRKENRKRRKPDTPGSASSPPSSELVHPAKRLGQVSSASVASTESSINGLPNQTASGIPKSGTTSKKQTKSPKGTLASTAAKSSERVSVQSKKTRPRTPALDETAPSPSGESKVPSKSTSRTTKNKKHSPNVSIPKVSKVSKLSSSPSSTASPSAAQLSGTDKSNSSPKTGRKSPRNSTRNSTLGSNAWSPVVQPNSSRVEDGNSSAATVKLRTPKQNLTANSPSVEPKPVTSSSINTLMAKTDVKLEGVNRTDPSKVKIVKPMKSIFDDDRSDEGELNTEIADPINPLNTFSLASPTRDTPEIDDSDEETNVILSESAVFVANNGESLVPKSSPTRSDDLLASKGPEKLEDDEEEEEEIIAKKPITEEDVERLHDNKWEGVNGCYDDKGQWFDWTQCLSVLFNEEEHPLHILPYVTLD
ncbi:uncharacterized protein [Amphiura filiformis]|uniref:uncharacterized protein isoform X2 n=1 Tax=Amphiura filiformis TaxID=82378 RepID=UPI003B20EF31